MAENISINRTDMIYVAGLVLFAFVSHIDWFSFTNIISFGDQIFHYKDTLKEFYKITMTWLPHTSVGKPNVLLFNYPVQLLQSICANLGLPEGFILNFTYLIPTAVLGFISPYVLSRHLTRDRLIAFTVAIFYGTTINFLIRQNAHASIAFFEAIAPIIFFAFMMALEHNSRKWWLIFISFFSVGIFYEIRLAYVMTFILVFFFAVNYGNKVFFYLKSVYKYILLLILLQVFWIFPVIFGGSNDRIAFLVNRGLENNFQYDLLNAFSVFNFTWQEFTNITNERVITYVLALPLIAFSAFLLIAIANKQHKRMVLYFGVIALVGIFLTKQAAAPFEESFQLIRDYIPGFMMFRSAYKLYFITSIGYLGLLSFLLLLLKKSNKVFLYWALTCMILLIGTINIVPYVQKKMDTNNAKIPQNDYLILKSFISEQDDFFRTLSVPRRFRWWFGDSRHPNINLDGDLFYSSVLAEYRKEIDVNRKNRMMTDFLQKDYIDSLFDIQSVKYVIIPPRDVQYVRDFWKIFYQDDRELYISLLDNMDSLKRVNIGTKEMIVYENDNYKSIVDSVPGVYSFRNDNDFVNMYRFISNTLGNDFIFTNDTDNVNIHTANIRTLFPHVLDESIVDGVLHGVWQGDDEKGILYKTYDNDSIVANLEYINGNALITMLRGGMTELTMDDSSVDFIDPEYLVSKHTIQDGSKNIYARGYDNYAIKLTEDNNAFITDVSGNVDISLVNENIINNGSFENGLWQDVVADCDNYDNDSNISMNIVQERKTEGKQSLKLTSIKHRACTNQKINVSKGEYILSFDYAGIESTEMTVHLQFDNGDSWHKNITIDNGNWNSLGAYIVIPDKVLTATLYIYAEELDGIQKNEVYYDNFVFGRASTVHTFMAYNDVATSTIDNLHIKKETSFSYKNILFDYYNLIDNPSFEYGTWKKEVADCANYDDNSEIHMSVEQSSDINRSKILQLSSLRHKACTGREVRIMGGEKYLLKFDYKDLLKQAIAVHITFNDLRKTYLHKNLVAGIDKWNVFEEIIETPRGSTEMSIYIYAEELNGVKTNVAVYDDFSLIHVPSINEQYKFVTNNESIKKIVVPALIATDVISPTDIRVHIESATDNFYLLFGMLYDSGWRLKFKKEQDDKIIKNGYSSSLYHFKSNGFLNGWYVDVDKYCKQENLCTKNEDGSYDIEMVIEFTPQRWFYLGLLISGTTFALLISYLGFDFIKNQMIKSGKWKRV